MKSPKTLLTVLAGRRLGCGTTIVLWLAVTGVNASAVQRQDTVISFPTPSVRQANATGPRVAFALGSRLYTQAAGGGAMRPATAVQARRWRSAIRVLIKAVSPDGKYRAVKLSPSRDVRIIREADGADMHQDFGAHTSIDGDRVVFDGWLDSRHFAVWLDGMAPNGGAIARRVMGVVIPGGGDFSDPAH
jgi:hypothetical protein